MFHHCWYLPQHGVCHPNKLRKIRVVFDFCTEHEGTWFFKKLLYGPDLTDQIAGVLLKFREEHIEVTGDAEQFFNQGKVPNKQRRHLRFL